MSRQFMYGTVMAVAMTVGLGAQSTTPQSYPQDKPQSTTPDQSKSTRQETGGRGQTVTLVGCLQSGDQSSTGATGTTGTTSSTSRSTSGTQFVLADATQSSAGKSGAGATGTAGTTESSASIPSRLNLSASGSSSSSWSKYLNHKVEVKGTLDHSMGGMESSPSSTSPSSTNPSSTNPSSTSPTTPPSTDPTAGQSPRSTGTMSSSDMGQTFRVTSIREIASTCSGSQK